MIKKLHTLAQLSARFIVSGGWTSAQQKVVFAFSIFWHQDSLQPIQASYPEYLCMYVFAFVFLWVTSISHALLHLKDTMGHIASYPLCQGREQPGQGVVQQYG